ncbi:hypothetical protein E2C01_059280 [Portunus trituberculatus]|uniref:Uncharacterized protein n=1 Tax=Portunus trituberculatus TaxID=210409 RepID=A0A5B7GXK8_PORTR|nr:hypothetical protein [Portunus trituberculatus]
MRDYCTNTPALRHPPSTIPTCYLYNTLLPPQHSINTPPPEPIPHNIPKSPQHLRHSATHDPELP